MQLYLDQLAPVDAFFLDDAGREAGRVSFQEALAMSGGPAHRIARDWTRSAFLRVCAVC